MAWHLYLVPVIGDGTKADPRRPKYVAALSGVDWAAMDYGFQPVMLVAANVDDATDTTATNQADVQRLPDNLDQQIGAAALSIVQNALETRNLPAGWVTNTMTYRELLRTLGGFFAFLQRYSVVANTTGLVIGGTVNLNTQFNQLPQAVRTNLQDTATSLGLSSAGITGTSTIRVILKNIADQWGQKPIIVGAITI